MIAAFVTGFLTHHFALTNVLYNYDDIGQLPTGYGTGITSGRWLLTILGDFAQAIGGNYNLPFLNGLIFLFIVAFSAGVLVAVLNIHRKDLAVIIGMLFSVFPSISSTLFFKYTAPYYGFGLLFSVLAVWVYDKYKRGMLVSALLMSFSLGIYQAYIPRTIGLFVLLLIQKSLKADAQFFGLVRQGFLYCITLVLGLVLYFIILNILLRVYGVSLSDYNGINSMGKIALEDFPKLIYKAFYLLCMMPFKDYCGLADILPIQVAYVFLAVISVVMIGYLLLFRIRKIATAALTGVLCLLFPVAVNFIVIMSNGIWIYTLMVNAFVLVPCIPIVIFECLPNTKNRIFSSDGILAKFIGSAIAVIIFAYAYTANINYTAMYYSNRQVENYINSFITQVRMTEEFDTEKKWVYIGELDDPLLRLAWDYEMSYGGNFTTSGQLQYYSRGAWIWHYLGYMPPEADKAKVEEMVKLSEVQKMPCWPDEGSIKAIDDVIVIKFQNVEE